MSDLSAVHELLANLNRMIAEDEAATKERIDRLSQYDDPYIEDQMRREWSQFNARVEPIRRQREAIIKQLADLEALKPLPPVLVIPADR